MLLAPITIHTHGSSYPWGGSRVSASVPEAGHRSVYYSPDDEEMGHYKNRRDA